MILVLEERGKPYFLNTLSMLFRRKAPATLIWICVLAIFIPLEGRVRLTLRVLEPPTLSTEMIFTLSGLTPAKKELDYAHFP